MATHKRHDILQLIAESVGAARLIERRARPHPACQRLIQQPAIDENVHGAIRRLDLHGAQGLIPKVRYALQDRVEIECAVALDERDGSLRRGLLPEQEHELRRLRPDSS